MLARIIERQGGQTVALYALFVVNALLWGVDNVLYARVNHSMEGYTWALSQAIYPASFSLMIWPPIFWMIKTEEITASDLAFPKWKLGMIAIMNACSNLLGAWAAANLPGALQTVAGNRIPETLIMSMLLLGARYTWLHVLGVVFILGAVVVSVLPELRHPDHDAGSSDTVLYTGMLMGAGLIPKMIYGEKWSKEHDVNIWFFRGGAVLIECFVGFFLVWTLFVHFPGSTYVPVAEFPDYMSDALWCFLGHATEDGTGPDCDRPWLVWIPFLIINVIQAVIEFALVKYASAATTLVVSIVRVPLQVFLFEWRFIAGSSTEHGTSWRTGLALVMVLSGVALYRLRPERSKLRALRLDSALARSLSTMRSGSAADVRSVSVSELVGVAAAGDVEDGELGAPLLTRKDTTSRIESR